MKRNLKVLIITILILCSCTAHAFATTTTNITSTTIDELQDKQNVLTNQIQQKNDELTGVENKISSTLQEIENLTQKIEQYESEVKKLDEQATEMANEVKELENKLKLAEEKYERQRRLTEERLLVIYESGDVHYLDILLNTKTISEFISTYFYLSEIVKNDTEVLQDLERERTKLEADKGTLAEQKNKLKLAKNNKEKATIALKNTMVMQNNLKKKLTEDEKALQAEIEKYESELKQIQAEIVLLTTTELGEDYVGGIMAWPVPGYTTLTSEYGMRFHPILFVYKLHTGIDIGAPEGANFIAAADGIVIKAEYNYSYGNMVIVDHGGGVTTLYAHGSEILVSVGQAVKRGQPVLKVGSTGYSTGPHAHFEVRVDGNPVQPLNFLKAQNNEEVKMEVSNET